MQVYEVWQYGYGRNARFRYKVNEEKEAIDKFLNRRIYQGISFRDYLKELGYKKILVCIKNPFKKGNLKKRNYPKIVHVELEI